MLKFPTKVFKSLIKAYTNAFSFVFKSDIDVVSTKAKTILADPTDRVIFFEAIEQMADDPDSARVKQKTIKLKNDELTLMME